MIKKIIVLFVAAGMTLSVVGQDKLIADKVVAVVGNSPILYSDVVKQAAQITAQYRAQNYTSPRNAMSEALEMLLEQKLLYNQSLIDSIGIERYESGIANMVNAQVDEMATKAGSIKALEEIERQPIYAIKDDIRKEIEEYYAASEMRDHVQAEIKVTPGEVDRFYRRFDKDSLPIIPEQYVYAQITKNPKSTELAKQRTREKLLGLRQRILDGERFDRLAVMYSMDPGSNMRGGEMDPQNKEGLVAPFRDAMVKLRPGQVSSVVETEYGFHIIQLIDQPKGDIYHVRHILMKPSYTTDELMETITYLDSLADVIRKGEITFAEAALQYSDDEASKMNGGVVSNRELLFRSTGSMDPSQIDTRFIKENIPTNDYRYLGRLKPGEISVSFIGTDLSENQMGKILKLVEIVPAHKADLSQDYLRIEQFALSRKKDAHFHKWLNGKIDEMYVRIDPMFSSDDFLNKRWFK
jgi:peptidyl-prolyl cis-trans isomerase SurA